MVSRSSGAPKMLSTDSTKDGRRSACTRTSVAPSPKAPPRVSGTPETSEIGRLVAAWRWPASVSASSRPVPEGASGFLAEA